MSRRERKRLQTRGNILSAASELFGARGFSATTMEEVAAKADVGVGTLYNYFGSKDRLLLGMMQDETERLLAVGQGILQDPGPDAEAAIVRLLATYQQFATFFRKDIMREIFAVSLLRPTEEVQEFSNLDVRLAASVGELLITFITRGVIDPNIDVEAAAIALYGCLAIPVLLFLGSSDMDEAALDQLVKRQVKIVVRGLAPRLTSSRSSKTQSAKGELPRRSTSNRRRPSP